MSYREKLGKNVALGGVLVAECFLLFVVGVSWGCGPRGKQDAKAPGTNESGRPETRVGQNGGTGESVGDGTKPGKGRFAYRRVYQPGKRYRYRIVRNYYQNGKLKHKEEAVSLHTVLDKKPPFERIVFEKLVRTAGEKSTDMSKQLAKFPPYEASIAKGAGAKALALPDLSGWDMKVVGVITDLHTFLVAVSPQAGVDKLAEVNSQHTLPKPVIASWANGSNVKVGQDCIVIKATLKALGPKTATIQTEFLPPEKACLKMLKPWMNKPVAEKTPNNFQQKLTMGKLFLVMWGREVFTVTSTVRRRDGMILKAKMENHLDLKMKMGCDENLDKCQHEAPLTLERKLSFDLIEELPPKGGQGKGASKKD